MRPQHLRRLAAVCYRQCTHSQIPIEGYYARSFTSTTCKHAQSQHPTPKAPQGRPRSRQKGFDVWGQIPRPALTRKDFESEMKRSPEMFRYSVDEYLATMEIFLSNSGNTGADWPLQLKPEYRPTKEVLNDLGYFMAKIHVRKSLPQELYLAMFTGASALGCEASCISATRMLYGSDPRVQSLPLYKPIKTRFDQLARQSQNPYILVLEGYRMLKEGKHAPSIRVVQRGLALADEDFAWRAFSKCTLAHAYEKTGQNAIALEKHREAAEGGEKESWGGIARLTSSPDERRAAWFRMAQFGSQDALKNLIEYYEDLANSAPAHSAEQKRMRLLAAELGHLKDSKA